MRRILVMSSFVAHGTVGLQATLPALPSAEFDVVAVPTVVLSNHLGYKHCAGTAIAPEILSGIVDALDANGWLAELDAVFTGYLPSEDHVAWAAATVERIKAQSASTLCVVDPVLGDDPGGLYVGRAAAEAVKHNLLPLADLTTPNRFELQWLTGLSVKDPASATSAARTLKLPKVVATSIPYGPDRIANILLAGDAVEIADVPREAHAPHGTGDYFAGLMTAALLSGMTDAAALSVASRKTATTISASAGQSHLIFASEPGVKSCLGTPKP